MKKAIFFILIAGLAIPGLVKAQSGYTSFQYQIGFGMGDLGDYISKTSFRGAVFDYQKVRKTVSLQQYVSHAGHCGVLFYFRRASETLF